MKTVKEIMKEYNQGLLDLDDYFYESNDRQIVFVRHVERHLKELAHKDIDIGDGKVHCKICLKNIDEIYEGEK